MHSDQVFDLIEKAAAHSGRLFKEQVVSDLLDDPFAAGILLSALNPFVTYGIAKLPDYDPNLVPKMERGKKFGGSTITLIEGLATRSLSGNAARDALAREMATLTPKSAELLGRIVTKDLRAGFTDGTVNRVSPGLIPSFDVMLAHPFEAKRATFPCFVEPKLDGVRVIAVVDTLKRHVKFLSRSGKEFTTFDHLVQPVLQLAGNYLKGRTPWVDGIAFDGEMLSGDFNKTVGDVRRKSKQASDAVYHVFDILPANVFTDPAVTKVSVMYCERRAALLAAIPKDGPVRCVPAWSVGSVAEIHARYDEVREQGLEGLIVKHPGGIYEKKRSYAFMKIKAEESVDVPVVGRFEGTGKYAGMLGGLIVDVDGIKVNVGGGFSDGQRLAFWNAHSKDLDGRLIEVLYHEKTPDGSLRHPRFKRFRDSLTGAKE